MVQFNQVKGEPERERKEIDMTLTSANGYKKTNYKIKMASYIRHSYRRVWEKDGRLYTSYAGRICDVTEVRSKFIYCL